MNNVLKITLNIIIVVACIQIWPDIKYSDDNQTINLSFGNYAYAYEENLSDYPHSSIARFFLSISAGLIGIPVFLGFMSFSNSNFWKSTFSSYVNWLKHSWKTYITVIVGCAVVGVIWELLFG